jgi:hypothetical protein
MLLRLPIALSALLSLAAIVVATPADVGRLYGRSTGRKCGSHLSHEAVSKKEKAFASLLAGNEGTKKDATLKAFTIPVYFHVVYASENISGGYVPDSQIKDQIDVLNKDYTGSNLSFTLVNVTRTLNIDWFEGAGPDTPQQTEMKTALRVGNASALNLYSVGFKSGDAAGLLGYATFPADYASNPGDDGVVILYSTVPGGSTTNFNLGRTSTHEIGHWVGLYHTFQEGCGGDGDFVDDTPPEAEPASGCPIGIDTCPGGGVDPIHNYMDYSDDSCMDNFTPGQVTRLQSQIATYRGIVV